MTDALFWGTLLLLIGSTLWTIWRLHGAISAAILVPLAWIVLIPISIILRPYSAPSGLFPSGFTGPPRDHMYVAVAMANVAFICFQLLVASTWFGRLQAGVVAFFRSREGDDRAQSESRLLKTWIAGLTALAVALALLHWSLMPRVPAWDLVTGFANPLQPNYDRETADKFLGVPSLVRYIFDWNQGIMFPVLFCAAVLMRWRPLAVFIGIFGFVYVTSTLEKFPAMVFIIGPFIALAVQKSRPIWSQLVIVGLAVSLLGPLAVNQAPLVSTSVHNVLHNTPPASAEPRYDASITTPIPGCGGTSTSNAQAAPFSWRDVPASMKDIVLRRIGIVPAEVTYGWFAYFPAQHPYLNGSGWMPWKVLASGYRNPANLVGLWMYCGHVETLPSVSAYGSFVADGWAEFGYLGVLLASVGLVLFGAVLELMRSFVNKPFCLACYAPTVILFATLPPRGGLMATIFSSGLWLALALCLLFLVSEGWGRRRIQQVPVFEHAGS